MAKTQTKTMHDICFGKPNGLHQHLVTVEGGAEAARKVVDAITAAKPYQADGQRAFVRERAVPVDEAPAAPEPVAVPAPEPAK